MEAIRCLDCDDVRWSLLGISKRDPGPCEMCGGKMVAERRKPERGPMRLAAERRDLAGAGDSPAARPSP